MQIDSNWLYINSTVFIALFIFKGSSMATRKERTRHPPTWFKLDSYEILLEVTNNQLCEEAFYRAYKLTHFCDLSNLITRLASGQICLRHEPRSRVFAVQSDAQLPSSQSIRPISIMALSDLHQLIEKPFPTTIQDEKDRFANGEPAFAYSHAWRSLNNIHADHVITSMPITQ